MLETKNVSFKIRGKTLVENVSLALQGGNVVAVVGPNGAGKSTLLKLLCGEYRPSTGQILLQQRPLQQWSARERAQRRAVLPQSSNLNFSFTALEVVLMGRTPHHHGLASRHDLEIATAALTKVGISDLAERTYLTLSGGERQQVQLARVLAQIWQPLAGSERCLLLDEPTASLDLSHQHNTLRIAREFAQAGTAVLTVLHDLNLAAQYADHLVMLQNGRVVHMGTPAQVLTSETILAVFDTPAQVLSHPRHNGLLVVPG